MVAVTVQNMKIPTDEGLVEAAWSINFHLIEFPVSQCRSRKKSCRIIKVLGCICYEVIR
jgi:hypothetical protein